jgi:thiol-disulfide isomerase/thioredoxin
MSEERRPNLARLVVWAFFFLFLAAWAGQNIFHCAPSSPLVGREAPAFDAPIVAGEGRGDRVALASLRGQPVLLDFWASWCQPCRASVPIISRLAQRHGPAGLRTYGVNVEAERPAAWVERAHAALGAGFPTLHDQGWAMQTQYGVRSIPTLVLVDRAGTIRRYEVGVPSEDALDAEIRGILAEVR